MFIILYIYTVNKYYSSGCINKRLSVSVLNIIHKVAITAKAPRKSPTANLNTVITLIDIELTKDKKEFTSNQFNNDETLTTKNRNL